MGKPTEAATSERFVLEDKSTAHVVRNLAMTPEAEEFLGELARKSGLGEGEVVRRALGMFKTALDARREGKHIGVTSTPDVLDTELVGF